MTRTSIVIAAIISVSSVLFACGGANAERAKEDIKGAGQDLSNGVGTNGKDLDDGVGTKPKTAAQDGGAAPAPAETK